MAYLSTFEHEGAVTHRFVDVFCQATRAVAAAVVRWDGAVEARRDIEAYSSLSDRTLADVGISRAEIQSIARHGGPDRSRRYRGQWKMLYYL